MPLRASLSLATDAVGFHEALHVYLDFPRRPHRWTITLSFCMKREQFLQELFFIGSSKTDLHCATARQHVQVVGYGECQLIDSLGCCLLSAVTE